MAMSRVNELDLAACFSFCMCEKQVLVWTSTRDACPELMDNSVFGQIQLADACVSEYILDTAVAIYFCHLFCV